mmetsp:Transcript_16126/g.23408  ORF Transcript_16126/g.23408 Transcript_16126/m.23408 type:complete len:93 (+) Transcript_16126:127-405(+)
MAKVLLLFYFLTHFTLALLCSVCFWISKNINLKIFHFMTGNDGTDGHYSSIYLFVCFAFIHLESPSAVFKCLAIDWLIGTFFFSPSSSSLLL